jgi:hypothetical protein
MLAAVYVAPARDPRVRVIGIEARATHGPQHTSTLTNAQVGFLLPLMVEVQHLVREPA